MKLIRIGTRTSPLAMWQANQVKAALLDIGIDSICVGIDSSGDIDLTTPLYSLGITGIFTKELDIALLQNRIDIAVHSLKDVPTEPAHGLVISGVLPRGPYEDVIVLKPGTDLNCEGLTIATSSTRRRSQWLERYPTHKIVPVRGNIQTRLGKLTEQRELSGMIFAKAGLERLGLICSHTLELGWMLPAPAQGIVGIICRAEDIHSNEVCRLISDEKTLLAACTERDFMRTLQGGCSVPVSCLLKFENETAVLKGTIHDLEGTKSYRAEKRVSLGQLENAGRQLAQEMLALTGVPALLNEIRRS